MTPRQFFDLVSEMRSAQKDYFAARKRGEPYNVCKVHKDKSIRLETRVDEEIKRVNNIINQ